MARFLLGKGTNIESQYIRYTLTDPLEYFVQKGNFGVQVLQILLDESRLRAASHNSQRTKGLGSRKRAQ